MIELFYIGIPVVRTDGRSVGRSLVVRSRDYQIFSDFGWVDYQPRPQGLKLWGRGWVDYHISLAMIASHAGVFRGARISSLVGREEIRAPLKMPAWEAIAMRVRAWISAISHNDTLQ